MVMTGFMCLERVLCAQGRVWVVVVWECRKGFMCTCEWDEC